MGYGLRLITPATDEPVTVDEAKAQCQLPEGMLSHNAMLEELIFAARHLVEERIGRQLLAATYELVLDRFPGNARALDLPRAPLIDVELVQYLDPAGVLRTWDDDQYIVSTAREPGRLALAAGASWPSTLHQADAVTIRFQCGYTTPALVPPIIRRAILMLVAHWFNNREAVVVGMVGKEIDFAFTALLTSAGYGDEFICFGPGR